MEIWQERGLVIANSNTIEKNKLGWKVPSQSGNGTYIVSQIVNPPTHEKR